MNHFFFTAVKVARSFHRCEFGVNYELLSTIPTVERAAASASIQSTVDADGSLRRIILFKYLDCIQLASDRRLKLSDSGEDARLFDCNELCTRTDSRSSVAQRNLSHSVRKQNHSRPAEDKHSTNRNRFLARICLLASSSSFTSK